MCYFKSVCLLKVKELEYPSFSGNEFYKFQCSVLYLKFSRSPERFSVSSVPSNGNTENKGNEEDEHQSPNANGSTENLLGIVYEFPWGQEIVETVNNLSDILHNQMSQPEKEACMVQYLYYNEP